MKLNSIEIKASPLKWFYYFKYKKIIYYTS